MPTYDYECIHCGHTFEAFQKITDGPIKVCPECGKSVKRLIGGGLGIIFKGSGFYTTDYKRSSANSGSAASKEDKRKSETGGNSSADKTGSNKEKHTDSKK